MYIYKHTWEEIHQAPGGDQHAPFSAPLLTCPAPPRVRDMHLDGTIREI